MTTYNEGDLIEVTDGETVIRSRVVKHPGTGELCINPLDDGEPDQWRFVAWHEGNGRTITVIEKAKPKVVLPTEDGTTISGTVTVSVDGYRANSRHRAQLFAGTWRSPSGQVIGAESFTEFEVIAEPPAVTAKKLVDALAVKVNEKVDASPGWYAKGTAGQIVKFAREIAAEFGVTE